MTPARIMIIRNKRTVTGDIEKRLVRLGYSVNGSGASRENAFHYLKAGSHDLILLEVKLKNDTEGIALGDRIRKECDIPVVYLSAIVANNSLEKGHAREPFDCIMKPFDDQKLRMHIEMALYKHGLDKKVREKEKQFSELEGDIRKSEAILKSIASACPVGIAIIGADRSTRWMSESMESINGYTIEERKTQNPRVLYCSEEEYARVGEIIFGKTREGNLATTDTQWVHKDGKILNIHLSAALINPTDISAGVVIAAIDTTETKKTEEVVRESEERFRSIYDHSGDAILLTAPDGRIFSANATACQMFGRTEEEICRIGRDGIVETSDPQLALAIEERKKTGAMDGSQYYHLRKDGTRFVGEVSSALFRDKDGNLRASTIIRDITKRKEEEQKLLESEERYRTVIEHSNAGIAMVSGGKHIFVNQKLLKMFGYEGPEDVIGQPGDFLVHPDDKAMVRDFAEKRNIGEDVPTEYEFKGIKKDGTTIYIHDAVARTMSKGEVVIIAFMRDITRGKLLEKAIHHSKQMLQLVLDNIPQRVFWKDYNLSYLGCNKAFASDCGYTHPTEIIGKDDSQIAWKGNTDSFQRDDRWVIEHNAPKLDYEEQLNRTDGGCMWVKANKVPLCEADGQVFGMLGTYEDITERKKAEEAVIESEERYRTVIEHSNVGIAMFRDNIHIFVNQRFLTMFGYERSGEVIGQPADFIIHPDEKARLKVLSERKKHGENVATEYEFKGIKKDGTPIYVHDSITKMIYRGEVAIVAFMMDVTAQKKAEEELRENQEEIQALMDSSPVAMTWSTMDGQMKYINLKFIDMFGYMLDDIPTTTEWARLAYRNDPNFSKYTANRITSINKNYDKIQFTSDERDITCKDGSIRHVKRGLSFSNKRAMVIMDDITERKRMENQLREDQEELNSLMDSSPMAMSWATRDGKMQYINKKFVELFGYSLDEIPTTDAWVRLAYRGQDIANKYGDKRVTGIDRSNEGQGTNTDERVITCKDGSIRYVMRGFSYNQKRAFVLYDDITDLKKYEEKLSKQASELASSNAELKRAEEALRNSREELQTIMDTAPVAVCWVDIDTKNMQYINKKFIELFGYTLEDVPTLASWGRLAYRDPTDYERVVSSIHAVFDAHKQGKSVPVMERTITCKDESTRFVQARGVYAANKMVVIYTNMTEQKRAEEALRESENKFKDLAEKSIVGIYLVQDNLFRYVNARFAEIHGYAIEELVDKKSILDMAPQEDVPKILAEVQERLLGKSESTKYMLRIVTKEGEIKFAEIYVSSTIYKGRPATIGTLLDITDRKKAEEELARRAEELLRSNAELEQFAYIASHDLQEPLRMVASYTELLAKRYKGKLDGDADEFIHFAVDGASRMKRLINDLLLYSRVGTKAKPFAPVASQDVLNEVLSNLTMAIEDAHATITSDPLPLVMADESQLLQLFQNLVANAIKFHGGEPPHVHVSCQAEKNKWLFSVGDNGIGIDPQYFERIFIIFQRLHSKTEYSGTGIGLAVCKRIVLRHGGDIWVESEPGKGSTFFFTIPMKREEQ